MMTLATKIVIMSKGVVQQMGAPAAIYHDPVNLFVARFIGSPAMSLLKGRIEPASAGQRFALERNASEAPGHVPLPAWRQRASSGTPAEVLLGVRPEHIRIANADGAP